MITRELPASALPQPHDPSEGAHLLPWQNLVAECIEEQHPVLAGRIRVRWLDNSGEERSLWVPTLSHLTCRKGDRVLVVVPDNWAEPLVTGVVDGFAVRPSRPAVAAATIALKRDEAIRVQDANGQEILEITSSDCGPVVRLFQSDVNLELPGALRVKAESLNLTASAGPVNITASHDVVVKGELVRLN
jgi:hypothetical protein